MKAVTASHGGPGPMERDSTSSPRISVVIPLYNKQGTIGRAIHSVLRQGVADLEVIVVDDGSTDGSVQQVLAIDDARVALIRQANAGPGRARNAGAREARAELLAFLDGDDEWLPGFLAAGVAALSQHPDAVAYACSYDTGAFAHRVTDKVSRLTQTPALLQPPTVAVGSDWLKYALDGLHSSATIVRTSSFRKAGGFYDRERCLWGEDSYLWGQILFMGPIYWDPTPRIHFHVEDSDLGFAVKHRDRERPLVASGLELMQSVAPEHRAAFFMLAQRTASDDADKLAECGHLARCIALRRKFRMLKPRKLLGDVKRYLGHVRRQMSGAS
jgi:glycosyltransferase involved in cell wall biosynthesis